MSCLYLPSTPLNVLLSLAHATAFQNSRSEMPSLWLIDQKSIDENFYYENLLRLDDSPFDHVEIFLGSAKGYNKLTERKHNFQKIDGLLKSKSFTDVFVGSDRRIEFQYIMHRLRSRGVSVKGHYLEDGLYSYAGLSIPFYKSFFNDVVKKIIYGFWWQEPETVGGSDWISDIWVMSPKHLFAKLQSKRIHRIHPNWLALDGVKRYSEKMMQSSDESSESYEKIDYLILIAHPHNVAKVPGYIETLLESIDNALSKGLRVAVKYHPRVNEEDIYQLKMRGVHKVIPANLAFEFVLPLLKDGCFVQGDVGTGVLMANWLRPTLQVIAVIDKKNIFQARFNTLFLQVGIKMIQPGEKIV